MKVPEPPDYDRSRYQLSSLQEVFLRFGYDIRDNDDVQRIAKVLRWAEQQLEREERSPKNRLAVIIAVAGATGGSFIAFLAQLIYSKLGGVK